MLKCSSCLATVLQKKWQNKLFFLTWKTNVFCNTWWYFCLQCGKLSNREEMLAHEGLYLWPTKVTFRTWRVSQWVYLNIDCAWNVKINIELWTCYTFSPIRRKLPTWRDITVAHHCHKHFSWGKGNIITSNHRQTGMNVLGLLNRFSTPCVKCWTAIFYPH